MAASALRFAARKICGRALERPRKAFCTTAASAAFKEEERRLQQRISHGGISLRRFSSSESPSLLNKNKQGGKSVANGDSASSSPCPPKEDKFIPTLFKLTFGATIVTAALLYVEAKYIFGGPIFGRQQPVKKTAQRPGV